MPMAPYSFGQLQPQTLEEWPLEQLWDCLEEQARFLAYGFWYFSLLGDWLEKKAHFGFPMHVLGLSREMAFGIALNPFWHDMALSPKECTCT